MKNDSVRKSNIELLRIVSMFMILTHHYVVNSGIIESFGGGSTSFNFIFLALFGMWGKYFYYDKRIFYVQIQADA